MIQDSSTSWDLRTLPVETSMGERLYMLLLLVLFVIGFIELIRSWRIAPPSTVSTEGAKQIRRLQAAATNLKQWTYFTFLAFGFLASYELTRVGTALSIERNPGPFTTLPLIRGLLVELELTFLVVIFAFFVRWRIARLAEKFQN